MESMKIRFDPSLFTIGDLEDFEEGVGVPLYDALKQTPVLDEDGKPVMGEPDENGKQRPQTQVKIAAKALRYLIWIVRRQEDPAFSLTDARNVRVSTLEIVGDEDGQGNDESGSAEANA